MGRIKRHRNAETGYAVFDAPPSRQAFWIAGLVVALVFTGMMAWAGITGGVAAVFDGLVHSTDGGFMFPDGSVQTTAALPSPRVQVIVDFNGLVVGPVVGYTTDKSRPGSPLVLVDVAAEQLVAKALITGLSIGRTVYFEEPGCTGQAKVHASFHSIEGDAGDLSDIQHRAYAFGPRAVLFRAEALVLEFGDYQSKTDISVPDWDASCIEEISTLGINNSWAAEFVVDLGSLITPPLSLE